MSGEVGAVKANGGAEDDLVGPVQLIPGTRAREREKRSNFIRTFDTVHEQHHAANPAAAAGNMRKVHTATTSPRFRRVVRGVARPQFIFRRILDVCIPAHGSPLQASHAPGVRGVSIPRKLCHGPLASVACVQFWCLPALHSRTIQRPRVARRKKRGPAKAQHSKKKRNLRDELCTLSTFPESRT